MTGYWIVMATVVLAILAVLIGLLCDLPEWQLPLRRQNPSLLYRVAPPNLTALDPNATRWDAAIELADPPLIEVRDTCSASGEPDTSAGRQAIESAVSRHPRLLVIVGAPALVLAGRSPADVTSDIESIVSRLAFFGCSSIVQGFYPPTMNEELRRSAIDCGALSRLATSWNSMLVNATERYGARVVHDPNLLQQAILTALNRPHVPDLSVSDGADMAIPRRSSLTRSSKQTR